MTPSRPYLIRAMYEWIVDNGMTPHILAKTGNDQVKIPRQFEEEGTIILNISPDAVHSLNLGIKAVSFDARFGGKPMKVNIPVEYISAIYTRENGQGMMFAEEDTPPSDDDVQEDEDTAKPKPPHLRIVK